MSPLLSRKNSVDLQMMMIDESNSGFPTKAEDHGLFQYTLDFFEKMTDQSLQESKSMMNQVPIQNQSQDFLYNKNSIEKKFPEDSIANNQNSDQNFTMTLISENPENENQSLTLADKLKEKRRLRRQMADKLKEKRRLRRQRKKPRSIELQFQDQNWIKNFLQLFKPIFLNYISETKDQSFVDENIFLADLKKKNGITKQDYLDMYDIKVIDWGKFFKQKVHKQGLISSKCSSRYKKLYSRLAYRLEQVYQTSEFLHIAEP